METKLSVGLAIIGAVLAIALVVAQEAGRVKSLSPWLIGLCGAMMIPLCWWLADYLFSGQQLSWRWWGRIGFSVLLGWGFWAFGIWTSCTVVTPETIEARVNEWAEYLGRPVEQIPPEDAYFRVVVTTVAGRRVGVMRTRDRDRDLNFQSIRIFTPQQQAVLDELPRNQMQSLAVELKTEAARADVHFEAEVPLKRIVIKRSVRIRPDLNEADFADALNQIDRSWEVLANALLDGLKRRGAPVIDLR
jgi:hypothetical protein